MVWDINACPQSSVGGEYTRLIHWGSGCCKTSTLGLNHQYKDSIPHLLVPRGVLVLWDIIACPQSSVGGQYTPCIDPLQGVGGRGGTSM